jgi:glycosyltransferase involved in cell wall biosynthesis
MGADNDPSICFFGEVDHDECLRQMAACDVILAPSRDDPLPFVTLDALALGKPLVCSRFTGTSEYLSPGGSGLILTDNSPEEIGAVLTRLITEPGLRETLALGGRRVYEVNFTPAGFAARLTGALSIVAHSLDVD